MIAPHDPVTIDIRIRELPPSGAHWMATDELGRDILSRAMFGGVSTLGVALAASILAELAGLLAGYAAGHNGGTWDRLLRGVRFLTRFSPWLLVVGAFTVPFFAGRPEIADRLVGMFAVLSGLAAGAGVITTIGRLL